MARTKDMGLLPGRFLCRERTADRRAEVKLQGAGATNSDVVPAQAGTITTGRSYCAMLRLQHRKPTNGRGYGPGFRRGDNLHGRGRHAAVDHDGLAGHEGG